MNEERIKLVEIQHWKSSFLAEISKLAGIAGSIDTDNASLVADGAIDGLRAKLTYPAPTYNDPGDSSMIHKQEYDAWACVYRCEATKVATVLDTSEVTAAKAAADACIAGLRAKLGYTVPSYPGSW